MRTLLCHISNPLCFALLVVKTYTVRCVFLHFQDNTLQVVIATNGQVSFVLYLYSNIEWGVANIGFNAGDNVRSFMVPGARTFQTRNIENGSNVDIPGLYMYRVDRRLVFDGENYKVLNPIAPIYVF